MDEFYESRGYFAAIAAVLLAGDIQARVLQNGEDFIIGIPLVDGGNIMWARHNEAVWGYSLIDSSGEMTTGQVFVNKIEADDIAQMIAEFDYPVNPEYPLEHPGDLTVGVVDEA